MPFGPYRDFGHCLSDQQSKGKSKESAQRICGALQSRLKDKGGGSKKRPIRKVVEQITGGTPIPGHLVGPLKKFLEEGVAIFGPELRITLKPTTGESTYERNNVTTTLWKDGSMTTEVELTTEEAEEVQSLLKGELTAEDTDADTVLVKFTTSPEGEVAIEEDVQFAKGDGEEPEEDQTFHFAKIDDDDPGFTFVWGPFLVPNESDHQKDIISVEEIEKAVHQFTMDLNTHKRGDTVDQEGDLNLLHEIGIVQGDADVVEVGTLKAATRIGKRNLKKGTAVLGVRVFNEKIRKLIKEGKMKGFSIEGSGQEDKS
jgi:hypothetical protein